MSPPDDKRPPYKQGSDTRDLTGLAAAAIRRAKTEAQASDWSGSDQVTPPPVDPGEMQRELWRISKQNEHRARRDSDMRAVERTTQANQIFAVLGQVATLDVRVTKLDDYSALFAEARREHDEIRAELAAIRADLVDIFGVSRNNGRLSVLGMRLAALEGELAERRQRNWQLVMKALGGIAAVIALIAWALTMRADLDHLAAQVDALMPSPASHEGTR